MRWLLRFSRSAFRVLPWAALVATACTRDQWQRFPSPDDVMAKIPWFVTMHRGLAVQPYALPPRDPVPGTVPITGADPELRVDKDQDLRALNQLQNPAPRTSESLNRGQDLFNVYCYPCHGAAGKGDGPVAAKFIQPPDLTAEQARKYSDGYVFALIRYGRGIMPPYGDKVRGMDRWHLVNYLRLLQNTRR
jgi:mono/diheme cytochrome c family protein